MILRTRATRATALTLSFALIHAAFGPAAWAQVKIVADMPAPIGSGSAGGAASGTLSPAAAPNNASLTASLGPSPVLLAAPAAFGDRAFSAAAAVETPAAALANAPAAAVAAPVLVAAPAATPFSAPAAEPDAAPKNASAQAAAASPDAAGTTTGAATSAEPALQDGAASTRIGARAARRFAELRSFFSGRRDAGTVPASAAASNAAVPAPSVSAHANGLAPAAAGANDKIAQGGGDNGPPAPPAPPSGPQGPSQDGGKAKGAWLGLGVAGASIIAYALAMQVGLEAQGVAMPQLTENAFKDFTLLPLVSVFSSIGSMIGQPMSKFFAERFGLAKTFYAAHALRALSLGTMVLLFGTGAMSMPLMMAFYAFNGVVTGVALTAEGTLRKLILADRGVSQQSFRTWWQLLAESLAVPAPIFFGALVHSLGAVGAPLVTALYPVTILLGLILAYVLRVYPLKDVKKASDLAAKPAAPVAPAAAATGTASVFGSFKAAVTKTFANMEDGKNFVMGLPYLKYALAGAVSFDLFNVMIYRLIAPGYGKMTGGEAGLSAVQGNIVGMFSLGGLLLSVVFIALESMAKKKAAQGPQTPEAAAAAERSSMLRWTLAGIPALALLATMGLHIALPLAPLVFLGTNWMPGSMLAAALVPFGFFQVAASIKLNSYYQEKLPQDGGQVQKALAFSGSVMTALSIVTMLALRPLFSSVDVFNPFPWLAVALAPIAVGLFFLQRKLAAATKPDAVAAADAAQAARDAGRGPAAKAGGAYIGLILGIVAAAVVITALPMIPGVAGALAGLSVLARFAVNLGLTLLIPAAGLLIGRANGRKKDARAKP